ncbi:MFS transporter [Achromobacter seleniivolatilans]|uniref:MFS transporter n=1 Tax=Achromobacter seleniivolatilans TaxID=3047478 RepID=A0ABY9M311_9BURK|nr:MFS transporter [Achromobacter sp. R39]WMD21391.1 MFS transporter [Achromobacter sp. R39]
MSGNSSTVSNASWADLLSGANALRSIALAGGVALHAVNVYIVTTILPSVIQDIGGLEYYAWNTTLFVVTSIVGSALSAKLIETLGPRAAYLLAVAVFTAGSIVCALAPSMQVMLAGRSVQGLGGGILFALSYALIRLVFDAALWSRAMALVSGMWGVATLCGPAIGGVFAQTGHWRLAFWALLPVAAILALIVSFKVSGKPSTQAVSRTRLPLTTLALLVASVLAISLASLSKQWGWNLAGIALGLAIAMLIAKVDSRATRRLLPSGAYSIGTPLGALYAVMCLTVAAITTEIFVPYFLQVIHGMTPLAAGYMTAAMAAGWTLAALPSSTRTGAEANRMLRLSPVIILGSLIGLAIMTPQAAILGSAAGLTVYVVALAGVGFGIGLAWPHLLTRIFNAAPAGEETLTSSSITTVQLYAAAVTAALAGIITNSAGLADPGGVAGTQQAARWLFATFAVAPALALLLLARVTRKG